MPGRDGVDMLSELAGTLPDLVLFEAVARAGSLSRAARALQMPVSTLSRRMTALEARRLGVGWQGLYAAPGALTGPLEAPADLTRHPCLRLRGGAGRPTPWRLVRGEEAVTVEVTGAIVANGIRLLAELAVAGRGVALLDARVARPWIERGELVRVLPGWRPAPAPIHAVTASRIVPLRTRLFLEMLRDRLDLDPDEPGR